MGFDISQINDKKLRKIAEKIDKKNVKDYQLDRHEFSIFADKTTKLRNKNAEAQAEYRNIAAALASEEQPIGDSLQVTTPKTETVVTNPVMYGTAQPLSKDDMKRQETYILNILKELMGTAPSELMSKLDERLGNLANSQQYAGLKSNIRSVLANVGEFNSKEDVERIQKNLKEFGKNSGDDFIKDLSTQIGKMVENNQRYKEYENVKDAFDEAYKTMNLESAYNSLKENQTLSGSYYKEILKAFEDTDIMKEARELVKEAISESENQSAKGIKKDVPTILGDKWDKYTKKALGGETKFLSRAWLKGEDSDIKVARKNQATKNVVEEIARTPQTKETILDALGGKKKNQQLFDAMISKGLIIDLNNGTYDLKPLSDLIRANVGANYKMDRQTKDFKAIAENTKTTSAISSYGLEGLMNLDDDQTKKLVELCGFKVQHKNIAKAIMGAVVGGLLGAAAGAGAAATNPSQDYKTTKRVGVPPTQVDVKTVLKFKSSDQSVTGVSQEVINELNNMEGVNVETQIVNGITFITRIIVQQPDQLVELEHLVSKCITATAWKVALVGAALGFINGLKDSPEIPITSTQFDCTDLETYKARLTNEASQNKVSQKYVDAILLIAELPKFKKEDGSWDCDKFKLWLNHAAGDGGILNREELIGALIEEKNVKEKEKPEEKAYCAVVIPKKEEQAPVVAKEETMTINEYFWDEIVRAKYPCEDAKAMTRALKIAQGITTNRDYSYQHLIKDIDEKYHNEIFKGKFTVEHYTNELGDKDARTTIHTANGDVVIEHFDAEKVKNFLHGGLGEIKLPDKLMGCDKTNNSIVKDSRLRGNKPVKNNVVSNKDSYNQQTTGGSTDSWNEYDVTQKDKNGTKTTHYGRGEGENARNHVNGLVNNGYIEDCRIKK